MIFKEKVKEELGFDILLIQGNTLFVNPSNIFILRGLTDCNSSEFLLMDFTNFIKAVPPILCENLNGELYLKNDKRRLDIELQCAIHSVNTLVVP